jgi:hypothetical protein
MNSVGGMNDLRGDFVWLHGSRRVAESAEENKPNGGRHSTENSEEPWFGCHTQMMSLLTELDILLGCGSTTMSRLRRCQRRSWFPVWGYGLAP